VPAHDKPHPPPLGEDEVEQFAQTEEHSAIPDETTVVAEEEFISPKGRRYRILKTRQTDPDDPPPEGGGERS
jgi:hypothetical protein